MFSDIAGDFFGSSAITLIFGFCSFKYLAVPIKVPPVPTPHTNISKSLTSFIISTAVVL